MRKKAADALAGFPMTPEIRVVFLEALKSDKNPAVRLVAVDALAAAAKQSPDASTIQSLREKAVDPQENGFVRAKAAVGAEGDLLLRHGMPPVTPTFAARLSFTMNMQKISREEPRSMAPSDSFRRSALDSLGPVGDAAPPRRGAPTGSPSGSCSRSVCC